jgi:hypothetical protein
MARELTAAGRLQLPLLEDLVSQASVLPDLDEA